MKGRPAKDIPAYADQMLRELITADESSFLFSPKESQALQRTIVRHIHVIGTRFDTELPEGHATVEEVLQKRQVVEAIIGIVCAAQTNAG